MIGGSAAHNGVAFLSRVGCVDLGWRLEKESQLFSRMFSDSVRVRFLENERQVGSS